MSILSGPEIRAQIAAGNIRIDPFDPARLNPNSYNLRLGPKLLVYDTDPPEAEPDVIVDWKPGGGITVTRVLDMARDNPVKELTIPPEGLVLRPGVLYLASTLEHTETDLFVPVIEGRSSVGRLGLCVHVTAGFGDVGFKGDWTLEVTVVHPLRVYAGVELCQIAYTTVRGDLVRYDGKYAGQRGPKPSKLFMDFRTGRVEYPASPGGRTEG